MLRLADVGALLVAAITTLSPGTATSAIPDDLDVRLATFGGQGYSSDLIDLTHLVALLSWLLPLVGVLLLVGAGLARRRDARVVARTLGRGLLATAGLLAVALLVAGFVAAHADRDTLRGALGAGIWGELDDSFWTTVAATAAAGLGLVAGAAVTADLTLRGVTAAATSWLTTPPTTTGSRAARGTATIVLGLLVLARPLAVVAIGASLMGLVVVLLGARDLVTALWERVAGARAAGWPGTARDRGTRVVGGVLLVALATVVVGGALPTSGDLPTVGAGSTMSGPCNGHRELCDRTYDDVAFPATHNSMSAAAEPGWFLAEQPDGVLAQLDHGIRVFLIDSWPGQRTQRAGVVANTTASRKAGLAEAERTYGPSVLQSALRLHESLRLTPAGPVEPYLCHALCELGSTEWEPLMEQVRAWLDAHPREVVTFFVQDEVSPADTAAVVEDAGLMPYVHTQRADEPWPTLGSMISTGRAGRLPDGAHGRRDPAPVAPRRQDRRAGHPVRLQEARRLQLRPVPRHEDLAAVPGEPLAQQRRIARHRCRGGQLRRRPPPAPAEVPAGAGPDPQLRRGRQLRPRRPPRGGGRAQRGVLTRVGQPGQHRHDDGSRQQVGHDEDQPGRRVVAGQDRRDE